MSDRTTENEKTFPDPVENPSASQMAITVTVLLLEEHTSNISLNQYNLGDMDLAAVMTLNQITDKDCMSLYPISILKQQFTNLEQTYPRCFLHFHRWTVKGMDCKSVLHSSKKIHTGRTSDRNSCYRWRVEWSLQARNNADLFPIFKHY